MIKKQMKRFYNEVALIADETGFGVSLDGRRLKTPAGAELSVPTRPLALAIMDEWERVDEQIDASLMPYFSAGATVIDRVFTQMPALQAELLEYAKAELICYRASQDEAELAEFQSQQWDKWLAWMQQDHQISFCCTHGIMPVAQSADTAEKCAILIGQYDGWLLSCLYRAVQLTSSFVLSYAFLQNKLDADSLFDASCLDELFQNRKWGLDFEAETRQNNIKAELSDIEAFLKLLIAENR